MLLGLMTAAIIAVWKVGPAPDLVPVSAGLLIGAICVLIPDRLGGGVLSPFAFGVAGAGLVHFVASPGVQNAQVAMLFAAAVALLACSEKRSGMAVVALAACVVLDQMGHFNSESEAYNYAGVILGMGAIVIGILGNSLQLSPEIKSKTLTPLTFCVLMIGGGWVLTSRYLSIDGGGIVAIGAAVAATVVHLLLPEGGQVDSLRIGVAGVIWIGLATLAFGLAKGLGMALAFSVAASLLALLGNRAALLSTGPLLGLVMYRIYRQSYPDIARALDIGQHYALIGISVGALLPLLPTDWLHQQTEEKKSLAGVAIWSCILVGLPFALSLVLDAKGVVGFVAGLGFSSLFEAMRGQRSLRPLALTGGIAAFICLTHNWAPNLTDLTRDQKMHAFIWTAGTLIVLGLALGFLGGRKVAPVTEAA